MTTIILREKIDKILATGVDNYAGDVVAELEARFTFIKLRELLETINNQQPHTSQDCDLISEFLKQRWARIGKSHLAYTCMPDAKTTQVCLELAKMVKQRDPAKNIYQLLIPTLEILYNDLSAIELDELKFHEFILSDDGKYFIPLLACLDFAIEDGVLKHTVSIQGKAKNLSESETNRLIHHSKIIEKFFTVTKERVVFKQETVSFGSLLQYLMNQLRNGGSHKNGKEFDSGENANV